MTTERYGERSSGMEMIVEKMTPSELFWMNELIMQAESVALLAENMMKRPRINNDVSDRILSFRDKLDEGLRLLMAGE